jgi:cation/acetate symporter
VVAFAFGLAAASFFPAIFLGIFSKRVNRPGAVLGMIVGLVFTMVYIILCTTNKVFPMFFSQPLMTEASRPFGISPQGIGTVGMLLNFAVTLIVSSVTKPPPDEVVKIIEMIRVPTGSGKPLH